MALTNESGAAFQLGKLVNLVEDVIGTNIPFDYSQLLNKSSDFLVETYREKYLKHLPLHLNFKEIVQEQTKVKLNKIDAYISSYNSHINYLLEQQPTVDFNGKLTSHINPESFKKYLNPDKKEYYKFCIELINLANQVEGFIGLKNTTGHVCHLVGYKGLKTYANALVIDNEYFQV
jgi:hypothetical protein